MEAELAQLLGDALRLQAEGRLSEGYRCLRRWLEIRIQNGERGPLAAPGTRPVLVPDTTLACVDCLNHDLAAHALQRTLERCRFERALFFTDRDIDVPGVETVRIPAITSLVDYARFMMKDLAAYVQTGFVLTIQYDGFVLTPSAWSREFQAYDYVGARWPFDDWMTVGNGGFSLRSRKLLEALQDPEFAPADPEDIAICRTYRPTLEDRYGILFAPDEVAASFSFETVPSDGPTFGFHGLGHLVNLFDRTGAEVCAYRPPPLEVRPR